ncbi:MAG TPA: ester cyclase [Candidatus Limnocylindrales bacterium]|nr:ester cyclase [Candidatus Limnocylindrales bacterium]
MSASETKETVRAYLERVVSRGEPAAFDELCDPEMTFESPYTPEPVRGLDGFREMILGLRAAFPDLRIDERDLVAEGDLVAARWVASGTHSGTSFAGVPASGRRFEITGMSFYRVRDGRIVEGWVNDDNLGMLAQLGVVPAPSPV